MNSYTPISKKDTASQGKARMIYSEKRDYQMQDSNSRVRLQSRSNIQNVGTEIILQSGSHTIQNPGVRATKIGYPKAQPSGERYKEIDVDSLDMVEQPQFTPNLDSRSKMSGSQIQYSPKMYQQLRKSIDMTQKPSTDYPDTTGKAMNQYLEDRTPSKNPEPGPTN